MNYLIYGSSYNLVDDEIANITNGKNFRTVNLSEVQLNEILDDLNYNSLFEEEKVIVVKGLDLIFESKKDNAESIGRLNKYLSKPDKNTILIFTSSNKINERSKENKELLSKLNIIKTPVITKTYELTPVLGNLIKNSGYGISQNALNIFAEKCACNYDIAVMEFTKLKSIKKDNRLISENDIENYISNYNVTDIFGVKDAIINKDINKSLRMLDDLESSKIEVIPIVVMLAKEYQTLYCIKKYASQKLTNDQISENMGGIHPYRVKLLRETSLKYKEDEILKLIKYLCNLDLKLVSEDNLGFDELRKFLLEL